MLAQHVEHYFVSIAVTSIATGDEKAQPAALLPNPKPLHNPRPQTTHQSYMTQ